MQRAARAGAGRMAAWRAHAYAEPDAPLGGAEALALEGARLPARRSPRDVLVKVHASSINPIDLAIVRGYGARVLNALRRLRGGDVEFPLVPGRDFAGVVAGAAPGADLAPGARVWGALPPHAPGAHAHYLVADRDWVSPALRDGHFAGVVAGAAPGADLAPGARVWGALPPHAPGAHAHYLVADRDWVSPALRDGHFAGVVAGAAPGADLAPGARVWGALPPHAPGAHAHYLVADRDWVSPALRDGHFAGVVAGAAPGADLAPGARVWGALPPHAPGAHAHYLVADRDWVSPALRDGHFAGVVAGAAPGADLAPGARVWGALPPHAPGAHAHYLVADRDWVSPDRRDGHFAGVVAGAAPGADLAPGARVWGALPPHAPGADRDWLGPAPAALDDLSAGGALYAALTATAALRAGGLAAGAGGAGGPGAGAGGPGAGGAGRARVLLLGLGGVGHAALQLLVHDNHQVVVSCAPEQAAAVSALGAAPRDRRRDRLADDGPFDVVLDCAGLGGAHAASLPAAFARYVTLSPPLLRRADALGLAPGLAAAAADLLLDNVRACPAPAPSPSPSPAAAVAALAPRVRWAFFSPRAQDIEMLRRRAEQGKFRVVVERAWGWRDGAAAYRRAAEGHARGKLLLDFAAP